eukprot:2351298-Amphidinium_carterae.1
MDKTIGFFLMRPEQQTKHHPIHYEQACETIQQNADMTRTKVTKWMTARVNGWGEPPAIMLWLQAGTSSQK